MRRVWMLMALASAAAVPGRATAANSRELTTFVYPVSTNNTYRLPTYALRGSNVKELSRCGEAKAEGLRFEQDGQTFHLDPVPDKIRTSGYRRTVRVQRGKSSCFRAEIRIVAPLLDEPDPASWVVEWSPARPDAIDIVVPSTILANDTSMQQAHRLVFPWANRTLTGAWADCATGCRWRVSADSAVRRDFLTRSEIPVRVAAVPLTGLGSGSGVFNAQDGSLRPNPRVVSLSKWQIKPEISRRVNVEKDQTEVLLTFPGAWAIKPMPAPSDGVQVVHTPAGPVLKFEDPNRIKPLVLTPGRGQLKAFIKLDVAGVRRQFLTYVARFGSTRVRMPPGMQVCTRPAAPTVDVGGAPASTLPMPFIQGTANCRRPTGRVAVTLYPAVLRASDVSAVALDWSPNAPTTLDIYLRSRALVRSSFVREDTELVVGDHPPGAWVGCFAEYCHYRIEGLAGAGEMTSPTIGIRSKVLQAERTPPLDAITGQPFEAQQIDSVAWRVPDPEIIVGVPFLDGDRQATGTVNSPVARFFQPGPVPCSASASCVIDPNQGAMAVRVQSGAPLGVSTLLVRDIPTVGVPLIQVRGEVWRPVRARLRLKLSTCRYKIRQLSRAIAGLNEASVLYRARLLPGSSEFCPGQDWSVTLKTGERGHAQLANGLLEVYLEAIPSPGEGGAGDVDIDFAYPSGQRVKIDEGAKLSVEPAPTVGPPRVSVRLPGGDLRPLATTLAVNRPNILYFDMVSDPSTGASSSCAHARCSDRAATRSTSSSTKTTAARRLQR